MLEFYGFREQPFGTTPDPRFSYPLPSSCEALASLICGVEYRVGFAALIAEPGMGKTTILFDLLRQYTGRAATAFIFNTQCSAAALLRQIAEDLGIPSKLDATQTHEKLKAYVAERGDQEPVLVVIDEAQNLGREALEAVRLLSDFETTDRKLLHIILAGQPQLTAKLEDPSLLQLQQRITMVARLKRLSADETAGYIRHRMKVAGESRDVFAENAIAAIAKQSGGVPREINRLCFNALLLGCAMRRTTIDRPIIEEVIDDLQLPQTVHRSPAPERFESVDSRTQGTTRAWNGASIGATALASEPIAFASTQTRGEELASIENAVDVPVAAAAKKARATVPEPSREAMREVPPETTFLRAVPTLPTSAPLFLTDEQGRPSRWWQRRFLLLGSIAVLLLVTISGLFWSRLAKNHSTQASGSIKAEAAQTVPLQAEGGTSVPIPQAGKTTAGKIGSKRNPLSTPSAENQAQTRPSHSGVQAVPSPVENQSAGSVGEARNSASTPAAVAPTTATRLLPHVSPPSATMSTESRVSMLAPDRVEARLIQMRKPDYPPAAKAKHIEGSVLMDVSVGNDGRVKAVHIRNGNPLFMIAATEAVREWIYAPATVNGQRVPSEIPVTLRFTLPNNGQEP